MEKTYTLIFIKSPDKILLGFKKRGLGVNFWNGYGGKLEENEDAFDGAIRELHEESNLHVSRDDLNYLGVVTYTVCASTHKRIVHIFTTNNIRGELKETDEMRPKWFQFDDIPYDSMWPDSKFWLPLVLTDSWLDARFTYKDNQQIVEQHIGELETAPFPATEAQKRISHEKLLECDDRIKCVQNI